MCGIAGYALPPHFDGEEPDLHWMTRLLTHRGPDSEGYFRDPGVGLGMRRLSIIDLETGQQPVANETGDIHLVFNGEIYNYRELRVELEKLGHRFNTHSDTEVLVHGYEQWGKNLPTRLRGMFAFAVWDQKARELFISRDHFGIKPLYYAQLDGSLFFASEIKSILSVPGVSRDLDKRALDQYLSFLYVPEPRTIFRQIKALPAGSTLKYSQGNVEVESFWQYEPEADFFASRDEALTAIRTTFEDSVAAMMVADVPLGLFLSSGIDSASILAMMTRHTDQPVRSFSIGFGGAEHRWDELEDIRKIAHLFGTDHQEFIVEPDIVSELPIVVDHFDQPFANPTAVILHLLSGEARQQIKVALSGTGGDEFFAGYPRYLGMRYYQAYSHLPGAARSLAAKMANRYLRDRTDGRLGSHRFRRFLESGDLPFDEAYARMLVCIASSSKRSLYQPDFAESLQDFETDQFVRELLNVNGTGLGRTESLLKADIGTYLPFNQLVYGDRMSMAQSLEVRVPFVDQELAAVAKRIPLAWNLRRGVTKSLFREAMEPFLPPELIRRKKQGLNLPIALWFRAGLRDWMHSQLSPERIAKRGYFKPDRLQNLIAEHEDGKRDHSLFLWALVVLELWHQAYLDSN